MALSQSDQLEKDMLLVPLDRFLHLPEKMSEVLLEKLAIFPELKVGTYMAVIKELWYQKCQKI
jgi:hypothetical protein